MQDQGSAWDGDLAAAARHRHGLYLVAALAAACGTAPGLGRSRLIWAQIADPPGTRPDPALPDSAPGLARTDPAR